MAVMHGAEDSTEPILSEEADLSRTRLRSRHRLLGAGVRVFAAQGIDGVSIEQISREAGYSRGAFYSGFGNKEEFVLATFRWYVVFLEQFFRGRVREFLDAAAHGAAADTLVGMLSSIPSEQRRFYVEFFLWAGRRPAIVPQVRAERERFLDSIVEEVASTGVDLKPLFDERLASPRSLVGAALIFFQAANLELSLGGLLRSDMEAFRVAASLMSQALRPVH